MDGIHLIDLVIDQAIDPSAKPPQPLEPPVDPRSPTPMDRPGDFGCRSKEKRPPGAGRRASNNQFWWVPALAGGRTGDGADIATDDTEIVQFAI